MLDIYFLILTFEFLVFVKAGNIDRFEVRFKCIGICKTSHALHHVEVEIVIDLNIKIIDLVEENIEILVGSFGNKDPVVN